MKKIKRVLHCVVKMDVGGAETFIMNMYRSLNRDEIQFDFLTSMSGIYDDEIEKMGGHIYRIPYYKESGLLQYYLNIKQFLKSHLYMTIHCHMDCMSGLVLQAAKDCKIPIRISHSHSTNNSGGILYRMVKNIIKLNINRVATKKIACSQMAGKWLFGCDTSQFKVINNGIDVQRFEYQLEIRDKIRQHLNISPDSIVIGHVGRMETVKNHQFLIDIFYQFQQSYNAELILVGDGSLRATIEEQVQKYQLKNKVHIIGNVLNVYEYYNAMDLFVFPSLYEGLPLTLIEAQVNGLPVIASNTITSEVNLSNQVIFSELDKSSFLKAMSDNTGRFEPQLSDFDNYNIKCTVDKILSIYDM